MSRVVHFEIHAEDPERAIAFYEELFDWKFRAFGGPLEYWTIVTGPADQPGIDGGLLRRQGLAPVPGQAVIAWVGTVEVADLDDALATAIAAGGQVVVPKFEIPGVGWIAYCKDTEGNVFGLHQPNPALF